MNKRKTNTVFKLLHSHAVTAMAVVLLFVSVGAIVLPNIHADNTNLLPAPVPTVRVTNPASYAVTFSWTDNISIFFGLYEWQYTYGYNGISTGSNHYVPAATGSQNLSGLICGQPYSFRVYGVDRSLTAITNYQDTYITLACPSAAVTSMTANGNTVNVGWNNAAGFDTGYTLYLRAGDGSYVPHTTTAAGLSVAGTCGTTYTAYVTASAGGQTGPNSAVRTITTAACPVVVVPKPAPTPVSKPVASPKPSAASKVTHAATTSVAATASAPATPAPMMPANFAADVQSKKIVDLTWDAVTGNIDHYVISRSTDDVNWVPLATTKATTYQDNANFASTYYYRLQAVGGDGQTSGLATAQATTDRYTSSTNTITSVDKHVSVTIPSGAFGSDYNCTLSSDESNVVNVPLKEHILAGPYAVHCIDSSGKVVSKFKKPVTVSIKTGTVVSGYGSLTAGISGNQSWNTTKSTYNARTKQLSFTLTSAKTFAAFGQKKHSYVGLIIGIFLLLLLVAGAIVSFLRRQRLQPAPATVAAAAVQQRTAEQEFRSALAAPDCVHKGLAQPVTPSSPGCYECQQQHTEWKALRICLICGHVGCSDDSDQQHALKHFQQTGHPIVYDYADPAGNSIGWCYIDQTYI